MYIYLYRMTRKEMLVLNTRIRLRYTWFLPLNIIHNTQIGITVFYLDKSYITCWNRMLNVYFIVGTLHIHLYAFFQLLLIIHATQCTIFPSMSCSNGCTYRQCEDREHACIIQNTSNSMYIHAFRWIIFWYGFLIHTQIYIYIYTRACTFL